MGKQKSNGRAAMTLAEQVAALAGVPVPADAPAPRQEDYSYHAGAQVAPKVNAAQRRPALVITRAPSAPEAPAPAPGYYTRLARVQAVTPPLSAEASEAGGRWLREAAASEEEAAAFRAALVPAAYQRWIANRAEPLPAGGDFDRLPVDLAIALWEAYLEDHPILGAIEARAAANVAEERKRNAQSAGWYYR
jgi:hypothetical protein